MTSDELRTELRLRLGNRDDLSGRLEQWLNSAYLHIATKFRFRELEATSDFATASGSRTYPVPTNAHVVLSLYDTTNERLLAKRDWSELERVKPTIQKPVRWARYGNTLILDPTPNGVYTIRVRMRERPPRLTFTGDKPKIPEEWDEAILRKATALGYAALFEHDKAAQAEQLYAAWISQSVETEVLEESGLEQTLGPRLE